MKRLRIGNFLSGAIANVILSNDNRKVLFTFFLTKLEYDLMRERDDEDKKARTEEQIIEELAALEHEQWTRWSKSLARQEHISEERQARRESYWIPYGLLSEETKEDDRKWARRALKIVRDADHFYHKKDAKKTSDQQEVENIAKSLGRAERECVKKSPEVKIWFMDVINYQVSTMDAQELLDVLDGEEANKKT